MSKGACYQKLLSEFRRLHLYPPIDDFEPQRGNLAYFIDRYYDAFDWNELYQNLLEQCNQDNRNEACWIVISNNYEKWMREWKDDPSKQEELKELQEQIWFLTEEYQENKALDTIDFLNWDYYPDWYLKVDKLIQWVNN